MPPPKQFAQKLELFLLHRTEWRWKQFRSQNVRRLCQILRDLGLKFIQHSSLPMFTVQLQAAICALLYSEVCHFSFEKCPWKLRTFMNEGFILQWFGSSELVSCRWSLGNAGRRRRRRRRTWNKDSSAFFSRVNPTTRTQSIRLQIQIWPNHLNNIWEQIMFCRAIKFQDTVSGYFESGWLFPISKPCERFSGQPRESSSVVIATQTKQHPPTTSPWSG